MGRKMSFQDGGGTKKTMSFHIKLMKIYLIFYTQGMIRNCKTEQDMMPDFKELLQKQLKKYQSLHTHLFEPGISRCPG